MPHPSDPDFRRRLIARVEALRLEARISRHDFHHQIGPVASSFWRRFEHGTDEEAWGRFSLKGMSRIGEVFSVGAELMQFDP